jgi:hypothetical protein
MVKLPILLGLICFASINQTTFSERASSQDLNMSALIVSDTEPQVNAMEWSMTTKSKKVLI